MDVAIYLRKSRDEADKDDVLSKHRDTLTAIAENNNWKYKLYEEIASGERIAYRPIMQQLLDDVENGMFYAVLVMDIDRLGRGNNKDWGTIYEAFHNETFNTLIVTPQKTYDLSEDTDEMMVDFQSLIAKMEYKQIKKRMMRGKIGGAKQGKWVCGALPYPYIKKNGEIAIDSDRYKIFRIMVDKAVSGESLSSIADYLNANKIITSKGIIPTKTSGWDYTQVRRILSHEMCLGKIIYGMTKGDYRKGNFKKMPRDQWIITEGSHESVITQEEYDTIQRSVASRASIPVAARAGKHIFSGLIRCSKCNKIMRVTTTKGKYKCLICDKKYLDGSRCTQRGVTLSGSFIPDIINAIFNVSEETLLSMREENRSNESLKSIIKSKKKELSKIEKAIERIYDLYEGGDITKTEFIKRKSTRTEQYEDIRKNIDQLEQSITSSVSDKDFIKAIKSTKNKFDRATDNPEKNKILKQIVKTIWYSREGDNEPKVTIEYL